MSKMMAAVDLGASSGRVIVGRLDNGRLRMREAARFGNYPVELPTSTKPHLYWDVLGLWSSVLHGLRRASRDIGPLASVGVDTWAVDYGLLDSGGALVSQPASYRCSRTDGAPERFFGLIPEAEFYSAVGLQVQPFNTVFQLLSEPHDRLERTRRLLMMPDLLGYWLTGREVAEVTNASTTGMLDPVSRDWQQDVIATMEQALRAPLRGMLGELVEPGTVVGPVRQETLAAPAGKPTSLVAVGSHDTASAIVAVPAERNDFAYISCGTWSLVGLELDRPIQSEAARIANLTNELGVDGTVRFLKNVMGLWVFNEAVRTWREAGREVDVATLVAEASAVEPLRTVFDINDPALFAPGDMASRIEEAARHTGQPVPDTPAEYARSIFDSLALAYANAIEQTADVAGQDVSIIHMVGGGVKNQLLCQLTADATGLTVVAGPVEGTALGNLVVQARAMGLLHGGLANLRQVVRDSSELSRFDPNPGVAKKWAEACGRIQRS